MDNIMGAACVIIILVAFAYGVVEILKNLNDND